MQGEGGGAGQLIFFTAIDFLEDMIANNHGRIQGGGTGSAPPPWRKFCSAGGERFPPGENFCTAGKYLRLGK